ncbi:MAG: AAA family ATPase [Candidatus Riflebacteria bacterium]|nr:AAA family ATPase [Candidatus Riflebacteria bacterium]
MPRSSAWGWCSCRPVLLDAYRFAAAQQTPRCVLLIDDLDTGLAAMRDNTTYTVNSQLLQGTLMNLCDDPWHVGGKTGNRVPVVVTGNDFSALYSPVTRFGRMSVFTWEPTLADRLHIVRRTFPEAELSDAQARALASLETGFNGFRRAVPVAFFGILRSHVFRRRLEPLVPSGCCNLRDLEDAVLTGLEKSPPLRSYDEILKCARELASSHRPEDFLAEAA